MLCLRGSNRTEDWYRAEIDTCAKFNVAHFDVRLSAKTEVPLNEMEQIIQLLKDAPKPILIHCNGGADRSGLVAALYCYAIEKRSAESARKELSALNGHVILFRPQVAAMDRSFLKYVADHPPSVERN